MSELARDLVTLWPQVVGLAEAAGFVTPPLRFCRVLHEARGASDADEARALAAVAGGFGWARFRSAVWDGGSEEPALARRGELLWAEWRDPADASLSGRVSPDPAGQGLRFDGFAEVDDSVADARAVLAEAVTLCGRWACRDATWEVYWGTAERDPFSVRRLFARFTGYTAGGL